MCILAAAKIRLIFQLRGKNTGCLWPPVQGIFPWKMHSVSCLITDVPVRKCDESWAQNDNLRTEKAGYKEQ